MFNNTFLEIVDTGNSWILLEELSPLSPFALLKSTKLDQIQYVAEYKKVLYYPSVVTSSVGKVEFFYWD